MQTLPPQPVHVLIVDDDPALTRVVAQHIRTQGMEAHVAANGAEMTQALRAGHHHIVVLDLMLGREDGLDLLRALRQDSDVPVIIATGHRREEIDRVVGLELGADDYMAKPFGLHELTARIRAVLRRNARSSDGERGSGRERYRFEGWELDTILVELRAPDGRRVPLTRGEYDLLLALVRSPGRPLHRDHLARATRSREDAYYRSIDVQILRLRRKLEKDPSVPTMIVTHRGVGYVFAPAVEVLE